MARMIDADKFSERILRFAKRLEDLGMPDRAKAVRAVAKGIKLEKTVDAVEVVRCKDCKHGMKSHLQPRHIKNHLCRHSWEGEYHEPDHFCSYGERRTDGKGAADAK